MRGATLVRLLLLISRLFQSTRPMRGATPEPKKVITPLKFQSTRPMRGATIMDWFGDTFFIISIHAPHAGRDYPRKPVSHGDGAISIHAPHAGRD